MLSIMKLRHYDNDNYARFITFCTHNRIPIFAEDQFCDIIIGSIDIIRETENIKLIG